MGMVKRPEAQHFDEVLSPFTATQTPPRRTFLERLFLRSRPDLFAQALETLLAGSPVSRITRRQVEELRECYGLKERHGQSVCDRLWRKAFVALLDDARLTDAEYGYLTALRNPLDIAEATVIAAEQEHVLPKYKAALQEMLSDGRLESDEVARLHQLAADLRIHDATAKRLLNEAVTAILDPAFEKMIADHRVSPQEFADFAVLAHRLNTNATFGEAAKQALHRYALFWRIENGDAPAIAAPIALQRGEECYYSSEAQWFEFRKQTRTVGYYSQGMSFRVARGVYYRVGASRPHRVTNEGLTEIDQGIIYITNKRVLFDGVRRNTSIRMSNIIAFTPYSDGIMIEKSSGRSPVLVLKGDAEFAAVLLGKLINNG